MTMRTPHVISVFGSNEAREGDGAYETARSVGRALAELGYGLANGGYGGTMEASARGAKDAGGNTIGVICSIWASRPNAYVDRLVSTAGLTERLETLIELGTGGYVVLPGATGTLLELAAVWERMCKGILEPRPIACVGEFWKPLLAMMAQQRPRSGEFVARAASAEELGRYFRRRDAT